MSSARAGLGRRALATAILLVAACKAPAAKDSTAPNERRTGGDGFGPRDQDKTIDAPLPEDLDGLEAELAQRQAELQGFEQSNTDDVAVTQSTETELKASESQQPSVGGSPSRSLDARCVRIAALADRICQLSDRMCQLADEHPDEDRYANACASATQTCDEATEASNRCEP